MTTSNTADLSKLRIDRQRESPPDKGWANRKQVSLFAGIAIAAVSVFLLFSRSALSSDIEVETCTVTAISPAQADAVLTASGYVVAQRQAAVASKATGRLEYLGVEEGDQVKAGQIIARLEADVSESNIQRIKPGQPCEIVLDAYPDTRYPGAVSKIVPTADRAKATVLTKIKFVERDERVLPEMSAKVTFLSKAITRSETNSAKKIVIPPAAITSRNNTKIVFVVRDDRVVETSVELGGAVGSSLEVVSGLAVGDRVVLNPPEKMATGMKVILGEK